ncbi:MAG: hypothetical protein HZB34_15470 [Nitrospirae bacterium]|nr:hypothetical protein [Nitrospirota bacterium]
MKAILQAAEGTVLEPSLRPRPAVGIHFGAARQSIEKGDYLGWEVQAKMLKEKGLAVSREIKCTIHKATGEKPTSCGCSWFGHHDVRLILFNHSTCEADPLSPMRKTVIRAVDRAPLMGRVYAGCHDELP